jgi:hypothetical protein
MSVTTYNKEVHFASPEEVKLSSTPSTYMWNYLTGLFWQKVSTLEEAEKEESSDKVELKVLFTTDEEWMILKLEVRNVLEIRKPSMYISRVLLPSFDKKTQTLLLDIEEVEYDQQLALDLHRQGSVGQRFGTRFFFNDEEVAPDLKTFLNKINDYLPSRVLEISQLFNQRIGIDLNRQASFYALEKGYLSTHMIYPLKGSFILKLQILAKQVSIVGEAFFRFISVENGCIQEGNEMAITLECTGVYQLDRGSVKYTLIEV